MAETATLSVLLVDDNRDARAILRRLLISKGAYHFDEAEDGASAIKVLRERRYDLVLTDQAMSPVDGLEFVRQVRRGPNFPTPSNVPIIMVSAHTDRHVVEAARDAGTSAFLVKPVSPLKLHEHIKEVMEKARAFVRTEDYAGPDRRRKPRADWDGGFRRASDKAKNSDLLH